MDEELICLAQAGQIDLLVSKYKQAEHTYSCHPIVDKDKRGLVYWAARTGHVHTLDRLLSELKLDPNSRDKDMRSPLHSAAVNGKAACIPILVKYGAEINAGDLTGRTPLMYALSEGKIECVDSLLKVGAAIAKKSTAGENAFHIATSFGQLRCLEMLLMVPGARAYINEKTTDGRSPLRMAVEKDHHNIIDYMIHNGADARETTTDEKTLLRWAVENNRPAAAEILAKYNPKAYVLHKDVAGDFAERIEILLSIGAKANQQFTDDDYLLHVAGEKCTQVLLTHGAKVDVRDKNSMTPLHRAVSNFDGKRVLALLNHGADVALVDQEGNTALHLAASTGFVDAISLLLQHDAPVNGKNNEGKTPLELAMKKGNREAVDKMIEGGAITSGRNLRKKLDLAKQVITLLLLVGQITSLTFIVNVPWTGNAVHAIASVTRATLFDLHNMLPPYGTWHPITVMIGLVFSIAAYSYWREPDSREELAYRVVPPIGYLLSTVLFTPFMKAYIQAYDCADGLLEVDPETECGSSTHTLYRVTATLAAVPLLYWTIRLSRNNNDMKGLSEGFVHWSDDTCSIPTYTQHFLMKQQGLRLFDLALLICRLIILFFSIMLTSHPLPYSIVATAVSLALLLSALFSSPYYKNTANGVLVGLMSMVVWCNVMAICVSASTGKSAIKIFSTIFVVGFLPCMLASGYAGYYFYDRRSRSVLLAPKHDEPLTDIADPPPYTSDQDPPPYTPEDLAKNCDV